MHINTEATLFFLTCDVPEPFCENCAQQHTRRKLDHELGNERKKIKISKITFLYRNLIYKTTHFCETCDVPKPFCTDCAQHHTQQKLSRDHELCDKIKNFSTLLRTLISE